MRHVLLLAGAAALGFAGPVAARPGMGHGMGNPHAMGVGNPHGIGFGARPDGPVGYGHGGCPPGLAKKNPPCVPPGQARKVGLGLGTMVPSRYNLLAYNALPRTVRSHHTLSTSSRYVYTGGTVYQVNPRTRMVTRVIRTR